MADRVYEVTVSVHVTAKDVGAAAFLVAAALAPHKIVGLRVEQVWPLETND